MTGGEPSRSGHGETTEELVGGSSGRGRSRWWLLLVLVPVLALASYQLLPDQAPPKGPTPTSAAVGAVAGTQTPTSRVVSPSPPVARPRVTVLSHPFLGAGTPWEMFARGERAVVRIQAAQGRVTSTPLPALASGGPVSFLTTSVGAVVRPLDFVPGYLVPDGRAARQLHGPLAEHGHVVPGPEPGQVWLQTRQGQREFVRLVNIGDDRLGARVALPPKPQGWITADGGGYPMIQTSDGFFVLREDVWRRITDGTVQAVGPTGWLVAECDDHGRCHRLLIDRQTLHRHPLPGRAPVSNPWSTPGLIAPDGSAAVVACLDQNDPRARLVDLHTGAIRAVNTIPQGQTYLTAGTVAWTPGSRWVLLINDAGDLVAIDARTGTTHHLQLELPQLQQLAVRSGR